MHEALASLIWGSIYALALWGLVATPLIVGVRAHRRGRRTLAVAALAILASGATLAFALGLVLLLANGYADDYGQPPAETLGVAIPVLLLSVPVMLGAWVSSGRQ